VDVRQATWTFHSLIVAQIYRRARSRPVSESVIPFIA